MSNGDKRSVSTDALDTLGTVLRQQEHRDAIHLAVECVVLAHDCFPGQDIGLLPDGRASSHAEKMLGVVDPFIRGVNIIRAGSRVWLVVYPRQIKSLRHVWEHPDFPASSEEASCQEAEEPHPADELVNVPPSLDAFISKQWIEEFVADINRRGDTEEYGELSYDELMEAAGTWAADKEGGEEPTWGDHISKGGLLHGEYVPNVFWEHWSKITGRPIPFERPSFFSCSC